MKSCKGDANAPADNDTSDAANKNRIAYNDSECKGKKELNCAKGRNSCTNEVADASNFLRKCRVRNAQVIIRKPITPSR
jgi:hypothetical protein